MNKTEFINKLAKELEINLENATIINDIIESHFLIGKKNKDAMIREFIEKLNVTEDEANKIYETANSILGSEIKEKLKHPFRSTD